MSPASGHFPGPPAPARPGNCRETRASADFSVELALPDVLQMANSVRTGPQGALRLACGI